MHNQCRERRHPVWIVSVLTVIVTTWTPVVCDKDLDRLSSLAELTLLRYYPTLRETGNTTEALSQLLASLRRQQSPQDISLLFNVKNCTQLANNAQLNNTVLCKESFECLGAEELLSLLPKKDVKVPEALAELCPLLLFQTHQKGCQPPSNASVVPQGKGRPTQAQVWGFGILAVMIISCCSLGGLLVVPFLSSTMYDTLLMVFEGLAVGSLIGSSLFHLMPQAFNLMGQDDEHDYLWKSLIVFFGVYLFYIIDKVMKFIAEYKQRKKPAQNQDGAFGHPLTNGCVGDTAASGDHAIIKNSLNPEQAHKHRGGHEHGALRPGDGIATVAWMIVFGDGIHNFIDGLSIGAAFSESLLSGASISLAVVCEEFPHELGDFAVLLGAGMTMRQAVAYNFLSALTCFLGLGVGILVGDFTQGAPHIFALAAGMFLYISLVAMMGELDEALEAARPQGLGQSLRVFLLQNLGIGVGLALLFVMAKYSSYFDFGSVSTPTPSATMKTAASALGSEYGDSRSLFHGYGT